MTTRSRSPQRTKEIDIRPAFGATSRQLIRTVMEETVLVSLAGDAIVATLRQD